MQSKTPLERAPWRTQSAWLVDWDSEVCGVNNTEALNSHLDQSRSPNLRIWFEGRTLSVGDVSPHLSSEDIRQCLSHIGVSPHSVEHITVCTALEEASIHFKHPHVAKAVAAMLQNYPGLLWGPKIGSDHSGAAPKRCTAQYIDLTAEEGQLTNKSTNSLYEGFDLDIYADNASVESASDSGEPSTIEQSSLRPQVSLDISNEDNQDFSSLLSKHLTNTFELPSRPTARAAVRDTNPAQNQGKTPKKARLVQTNLSNLPSVSSVPTWKRQAIKMPETPYNKARRILLPCNDRLPILTVSMRADMHFFDRQHRSRVSALSSGNSSDSRRVVDALITNDVAFIGYNKGPSQLSLVRMSEQGGPFCLIDLDHRPHTPSVMLDANTGEGSISCLAAKGARKDHIELFTGGYDKVIRLWSVTDMNVASSKRITTVMAIPDALALRDNRLLISTSSKAWTVDLGHLTARPTAAQFSNLVYQMHVRPQAPNVTIMEVKHLEYQFEIFDDRISHGFNRGADCHFGYRGKGGPPSKFSKGDIGEYAFVKGYNDGTVCRWDFRNLKTPILDMKEHDFDPIVHTVFDGPDIIAYGKDNLTFITGM